MEQSGCGRFRCHASKLVIAGKSAVRKTCQSSTLAFVYVYMYRYIYKEWNFGVVVLPGRFPRAKCKQGCPSVVITLFALC